MIYIIREGMGRNLTYELIIEIDILNGIKFRKI